MATVYTYDPVSRLNDLKLDFAGTADDLTSTFAYNPASQIAANTRSNDPYSWTGHGSGTTSTTSNGLNQLGSWVSTLSYDTKGNVTVDGTYTYGYSSENLLTSLVNSATGALQPTIAFSYDPLMRLAKIDSSNSAFDVDFGYDGSEMALEGLSAGRTRRYVYGPGVDEPLVGYLVTSTGTSRLWYQGDERGSIARLSNDAGTPGGIGKFDEYGQGGTSRFRYTGQYWLGEANLLYYRARIYDPRLGRFLQPDPIGYGAGTNMYAYVRGDPVNFIDPQGLQEQCGGDGEPECEIDIWGHPFGGGAGSGSGNAGGSMQIIPNDDINGDGVPDEDIVVTGIKSPPKLTVDPSIFTAYPYTLTYRSWEPICVTGERLILGRGYSATLFAGILGFSLGADATLSIPFSSIGDLSFRGTQLTLSGSVTGLLGFGGFAGIGQNVTLGLANGRAEPGVGTSSGSVVQLGAGDGGGVEVSGSILDPNLTESISAGPRGAIGAYGAYGKKFTGQLTIGSGC